MAFSTAILGQRKELRTRSRMFGNLLPSHAQLDAHTRQCRTVIREASAASPFKKKNARAGDMESDVVNMGQGFL